jgi:sugar phosphate isomerase/epimerase
MKPGFMSSVCPTQTLLELVHTAERFGYQGLEFRLDWGQNHGVELEATSEQRSEARRILEDHGIAVSCIATGVKFASPDPDAHIPQRERLRRTIELASDIGAPYLRTFADPLPEDDPEVRERVLSQAADSYAAVSEWAGASGVEVLLETHSNMKGEWAKAILDRAQSENLQVLWHIGHHLRRGQSVTEAYAHIRGHVRHVHFAAREDDPHVSDADNQRSFDLLAADGFDGFFSVEIINPEDPEAVLQRHITKFKAFMAALDSSVSL